MEACRICTTFGRGTASLITFCIFEVVGEENTKIMNEKDESCFDAGVGY
jgi:hypothetical protein